MTESLHYDRPPTRGMKSLGYGHNDGREQLLEAAQQRLRALVHDMLDGDRLRRWEETDDVLQDVLVSLHQHLADARPSSEREFFSLAAFHIRRALIRLARHYYGPHGLGTNHASGPHGSEIAIGSIAGATQSSTPSQVVARSEQWLLLQDAVEQLPAEQREVTELIWLHGLTQVEAAQTIGVTERTVRRRWQRARLALQEALNRNGDASESQ